MKSVECIVQDRGIRVGLLLQYDEGPGLGWEHRALVPVWHRRHGNFSLKERNLEERESAASQLSWVGDVLLGLGGEA